MTQYSDMFSEAILSEIFPAGRTDDFFEALFGDAEEGSYDISLDFDEAQGDTLKFQLRLDQRPGKCLACNLTYGLPQVFSRHPIINVQGIADQVARTAGRATATWKLGTTRELTNKVHVIPLVIELA